MNNSKKGSRRTWSESDALIACKMAKEYNYSDDAYSIIGRRLNRSQQGVRMLVSRVHEGTHSLIVSHDSIKLAKYVDSPITKTPERNTKTATRQPVSQKGISVLWGAIEWKY